MSGTRAAAQKAGTRPERHEPSITPFQPTGPYPQVMLDLPTGNAIPVSDAAAGDRIVIDGTLVDGAGKPVADAMVETWQADAAGRYHHPQDPHAAHADPAFWGYRRVATDESGRFRIATIKPGSVEGPPEGGHHEHDRPPEGGHHEHGGHHDRGHGEHRTQAPHIVIALYGGGILHRYVTRMYFEDEPATSSDPVLAAVPAHRRQTLIARRAGDRYRFDIRLQGDNETVFFDL